MGTLFTITSGFPATDVLMWMGLASKALGSLPSTRWLLEHGADPNAVPSTDRDGDILTIAAERSSLAIVRLLVEHGADVRGTRALHIAAGATNPEIGGKVSATRLEVMGILLDAGADVNEMEMDPKGRRSGRRQRTSYTGTPLHYAIQFGTLAAVEYLLARGAGPMAPAWSGHTALRAAEMVERQDVIDVLRKYISGKS
jgi:ankyrin repeat protein